MIYCVFSTFQDFLQKFGYMPRLRSLKTSNTSDESTSYALRYDILLSKNPNEKKKTHSLVIYRKHLNTLTLILNGCASVHWHSTV